MPELPDDPPDEFDEENLPNTVVVEVDSNDPREMVGALATVLTAAIDSFCGHEATGDYSYGHIVSALTCALAVKIQQSGVLTEADIESSCDEFRAVLIGSIRSIYVDQANARKLTKQEN